MEKTYQNSHTEQIALKTKEEAAYAIRNFCRDYCKKDAIGQFHCSGRDSEECEAVKEQIVSDFSDTS